MKVYNRLDTPSHLGKLFSGTPLPRSAVTKPAQNPVTLRHAVSPAETKKPVTTPVTIATRLVTCGNKGGGYRVTGFWRTGTRREMREGSKGNGNGGYLTPGRPVRDSETLRRARASARFASPELGQCPHGSQHRRSARPLGTTTTLTSALARHRSHSPRPSRPSIGAEPVRVRRPRTSPQPRRAARPTRPAGTRSLADRGVTACLTLWLCTARSTVWLYVHEHG